MRLYCTVAATVILLYYYEFLKFIKFAFSIYGMSCFLGSVDRTAMSCMNYVVSYYLL